MAQWEQALAAWPPHLILETHSRGRGQTPINCNCIAHHDQQDTLWMEPVLTAQILWSPEWAGMGSTSVTCTAKPGLNWRWYASPLLANICFACWDEWSVGCDMIWCYNIHWVFGVEWYMETVPSSHHSGDPGKPPTQSHDYSISQSKTSSQDWLLVGQPTEIYHWQRHEQAGSTSSRLAISDSTSFFWCLCLCWK